MTDTLTRSDPSMPTICLACGSWLRRDLSGSFDCPRCGALPRVEWRGFYELALRVDMQVEKGLMEPRYNTLTDEARRIPAAHGWTTEILSIVSAFVLGTVTNAGYDVIKAWLLSKRKHVQAKANVEYHFHYHQIVEVVSIYLAEHPEIEREIKNAEVGSVTLSSVADEISQAASEQK